MKLAVWSPLPPTPSGVADYVAEQLPGLRRHFEVVVVVEDLSGVDRARLPGIEVVTPAGAAADIHLYHLGNSPSHAFAYRAARARPGIVFLHEWSLHHLVLHETVERGDVAGYLREMRRAHGEKGSFVGRQVARGLGGELLPALLPLNDRVIESCLAVVTLTREAGDKARRRVPGRPVLSLPMHFASPLDPPPTAREARAQLGLPQGAFIVTAPGLATAAKRLGLIARAVGKLREHDPEALLVVAGELDPVSGVKEAAQAAGLRDGLIVTGRLSLPDFVRHVAAADVVAALRFPSHGEMSAALVRALGIGRPALVSAGTPAGLEFPDGVVVPVTPGPLEEEELVALLGRLRDHEPLRSSIGALAREHVRLHHDLRGTTDALADFIRSVAAQKEKLASGLELLPEEGSLQAFLQEEVRRAARELGLSSFHLGKDALFSELPRARH